MLCLDDASASSLSSSRLAPEARSLESLVGSTSVSILPLPVRKLYSRRVDHCSAADIFATATPITSTTSLEYPPDLSSSPSRGDGSQPRRTW